jgi:hypothetical protein
MPINPTIFPTSLNGRQADSMADLQRRVAVLERGGGSVGSPAGGDITTVGDATTTVKGKLKLAGHLDGTADAPILSTAATPQTAKFGLGTPAGTALLHIGSGTAQAYYGNNTPATMAEIKEPTTTTAAPGFKISQVQTHTPTGSDNGGFFEKQSAITAVAIGTAATKAQPTAIFGHAFTSSTQGTSANINSDATAVAGIAGVYGAGATGAAVGVYGEGNISNAGGALGGTHDGSGQGVEAQIRNNGGSDHTFSSSAFPWTRGIWCISSGANKAGAGLVFARYGTPGFDVGIAFPGTGSAGATLGDPIVTASIRDECTAGTSLYIGGTHADAAIGIEMGSGYVGIGDSTPLFPLTVSNNTNLQTAYFNNAGAFDTSVSVDSSATGRQALTNYGYSGNINWRVGRNASGNFIIRDHTNTLDVLTAAPQATTPSVAIGITPSSSAVLRLRNPASAATTFHIDAVSTGFQSYIAYGFGGAHTWYQGRNGSGNFVLIDNANSFTPSSIAPLTLTRTVRTGAMTDVLWKDETHGSLQQYFGVGNPGLRYNIYHGNSSAPNTAEGATFHVSRYEEFASDVTESAEGLHYSAISARNVGSANTRAQVVGIASVVTTSSDETASASSARNSDCLATHSHALVTGAGTGRALGGNFLGFTNSSATQRITGLEAVLRNNNTIGGSGTDGTYDPATLGTNSMGIHISHFGTKKVSCGILLNNNAGAAAKYLVGIGIPDAAPIQDQSFRDDGAAATSVYIAGTHATAAIGIAAGAGNVGIGTLTPAARLNLGYTAAGAESTVAADGILFGDDTNLYRSAADVLKTDDQLVVTGAGLLLQGTGANAFLHLQECTSTPSTPGDGAATRVYMKADKLIILYNHGGTAKYRYLDLTSTDATWTYTTTAP